MSRASDKVIQSVSVTSQLTDHSAIECILKLKKPPLPRKVITSRNLKQIDHSAIDNELINSTIFKEPSPDLDDLCLQYNTTLTSILDCHAPSKTRTILIRPNTQWIDESIFCAKRKQRKYERMWRSSQLEVHLQMYKQQRDLVNKMIRAAKSQYYEEQVTQCGTNQRKLFGVVKSLMEPKTDSKISLSADTFSDFFVTKIDKIRETFTTSTDEEPGLQLPSALNDFESVSADKLIKLILASRFKICDLDPWPTCLVKDHIQVLSSVLCQIVNQSLREGHFSISVRQALVTFFSKSSPCTKITESTTIQYPI